MKKLCKRFGLLAALMLCAVLFTAPVSAAGWNIADTSLSNSGYNRYGTVYSLEGTGASTETFTYSVPKNGATVLVFFKGTGACGNSNAFFQGLYETQWAYDESINIVAVETSKASRATVQSYFDAYDPDGLVDHVYYNSSSNYVAFWYKGLVGMDSSSISFTCAMIVTESGGVKYVQYAKEGLSSSTALTYTLGQFVDISDPEARDSLVQVTVPGSKRYDYAKQVFDSVNTQRKNAGVQSLTYSAQLTEMAMQRAAECAIYYSHTRPNRESCSTVFEEYPAYTGSYRGENIAYGYDTAASVMTGWMNSQGHRENILRNTSTQIGVGCFENNGVLYWVQLFGAGSDSAPTSKSSVRANVPVKAFASILDVYAYDSDSLTVTTGGEVALPKLYSRNSEGWYSTIVLPKISQVKNTAGTVLATATAETGTGVVMLTGMNVGSGTVELRAYEGQESVLSVPLTVKAGAIAVTKQPANVTVNAGSAAKFSVTASGTGLTYQWQYKGKNGTVWANTSATGNKTATLTVPASAVKMGINGNQYRCKITNSAGNTICSAAATLTVRNVAIITAQPKNITVNAGSAAKFTVAASGTGLTYQWQYKGKNGTVWANTSATGNKTATLTVPASAVKVGINGNQYRCKITNSAGNTVYSAAATLTVKAPLAITVQPKSITVAPRTAAKFSVAATGSGLTYQWQYKNGSSWANTSASGNKTATLTVPAASVTTAINGRQYRCIIKDSAGNSVTSAAATLTVKVPLAVTGQTKGVSTTAGVAARFSVTASGTGLKYQWQYKSAGGTTWANTSATGNKTANLTIPANAVKASISGNQYRCRITDAYGNMTYSAAATLTVKSGAAVVGQTRGVTSGAGAAVQFSVANLGSGFTYQWQYKSAGGTTWANTSASGNKTATMTIPAAAVKKGISGNQYRCIIKDAYGGVIYSAPAGLTVK